MVISSVGAWPLGIGEGGAGLLAHRPGRYSIAGSQGWDVIFLMWKQKNTRQGAAGRQ